MKRSHYNIKRFIFFSILIVVIVLPILAALLMLEKNSSIYETKAIQVAHAAEVRAFAKRIFHDVFSKKQMALAFACEDELNSLMAFANRSLPFFSGRVSIEHMGMLILTSIQIPQNPFGQYINCRFYFSPSEKGLNINKVVIGELRINGQIAQVFLKFALNIIMGQGQGSDILDAIKKVSFKDKVVSVHFTPLPDLKFRFNMFKNRIKTIRDSISPLSDPVLVKKYYLKLFETEQTFRPGQLISLSEYLKPLFKMAQQRSKSGNYVQENRAAILALSIYAGHWRFKQFIGNIGTKHLKSNSLIKKNIVLAGRQDLRLHFIVSAGIKVLADSGISFTAGEFKELLDAVSGGSGFSFADLAADRAGTHFAQTAITNNSEAAKLQQIIISNPKETAFFPDISGLPEGISQAKFKKNFESVESKQYRALVQKIDQQIMALPAYDSFSK